MKQLRKRKSAHDWKMASALAALVVVSAIFFLSADGASAKPYRPVTYYVNLAAEGGNLGTSWADAFTDLQDALDVSVSGDEIWVAAGTYTPTQDNDRTAAFILKSGVALYGGFAGDEKALRKRSLDPSLTVLSGDIGTIGDDSDNSYHVVYADGVTDAVLDGFTVTGGRAEYGGGGMFNQNSVLTVSNCVFSDNQAEYVGGGMYNHNSALSIYDCIFNRNQAGNYDHSLQGGGGMFNKGTPASESQTIIYNCIFSENQALVVSRVDLFFNGGGGMCNLFCSPLVDSCTFEKNCSKSWGRGGGMYNYEASPTVTNCVFNANEAFHGGGMHNSISYAVVTNSIFNANWAREAGGAIEYYGSSGAIMNSTFYRNGWSTCPTCPWPEDTVPYTEVGGGIYIDKGLRCTIINVIFDSNAVKGVGGAVEDRTSNSMQTRTTLESCLFHGNIKQDWDASGWLDEYPVMDHIHSPTTNRFNLLFGLDPLFVDASGGDFHLRYDSPCLDAGYNDKPGRMITWDYQPYILPTTDFDGDKRIIDGDGDGTPAIDIGADEFIPTLPDLGAFLQALLDAGEIVQAVAERLLAYVNEAQTALDQEEKETAISILSELIADVWVSLGDIETAQIIERKTQAVIEEI